MNFDICAIKTNKLGSYVDNVFGLQGNEYSVKNAVFTPAIESRIDGVPIPKFFG